MSVNTLVYLHCDGCGDAWTPDVVPGDIATEQRLEARQEGWHVSLPGGRDICGDCWTAGKR